MPAILRCINVSKHFGAVKAVDGATISVEEGTLHSIIGPNGAGKTTLFNCISGELNPTSGEILFDGVRISGRQPFELPAFGIGRSFQKTSIFPSLTVAENVWITAFRKQAGGAIELYRDADHRDDVKARIADTLHKVGLAADAGRPAATIGHGGQRLLDLAIALAPGPRLLLLDEPAAGLSAPDTRTVARLIESLKGQLTILLIEHKMDVVMSLSDRISVMHLGRVLAEGTPGEVAADGRVREAYLGRRA
jgi:branched-chain amino acid transport system ATP-binding protein